MVAKIVSDRARGKDDTEHCFTVGALLWGVVDFKIMSEGIPPRRRFLFFFLFDPTFERHKAFSFLMMMQCRRWFMNRTWRLDSLTKEIYSQWCIWEVLGRQDIARGWGDWPYVETWQLLARCGDSAAAYDMIALHFSFWDEVLVIIANFSSDCVT